MGDVETPADLRHARSELARRQRAEGSPGGEDVAATAQATDGVQAAAAHPAHPFRPEPPLATSRPYGYREPPTTTLSRIHREHPDWTVDCDGQGWKAWRGDEVIRARNPLSLEAKLDALDKL